MTSAPELVISDAAGSQLSTGAGGAGQPARRPVPHGGPLKITDPAAFKRMVADMDAKSKEQKRIEETREAERARREGDEYRSPEERLAAARPAPAALARSADPEDVAGGGAHSGAGTFDPEADYYGTLGLARSAGAVEVRTAYRSVALLYHPDKHAGVTGARQDAIRERFLAAREAARVLGDERLRSAYDRILDFRSAGGGAKALPALSPEERAMVARGAGELARLRRQNQALRPAPTRRVFAELSLERLDAGGAGEVAMVVRRVDACGMEHELELPLAVPFRAGSRPGDIVCLRGAGDEAPDASRGDVEVELRRAPHRALRPRAGTANDLDAYVGTLDPAALWTLLEVPTPDRVGRLLAVSRPRLLLVGGPGLAHAEVFRGCGLRDHNEPLRAPRGDLHATVRVPPRPLPPPGRARPLLRLSRATAVLVAGREDRVGGALAGGFVAGALARERLRSEVWDDGDGSAGRRVRVRTALLTVPGRGPSAAAKAVASAAGLAAEEVLLAGPLDALLDEETAALAEADVLIVDDGVAARPASAGGGTTEASGGPAVVEPWAAVDGSTAALARSLAFWAAWRGALVIAVGRGVEALGRGPVGVTPGHPVGETLLPRYALRVSGEDHGWQCVREALEGAEGGAMAVGVLAGGVTIVDAVTGTAETLAVPPRDALIARARVEAAVLDELDEADDDYGFMYAVAMPEC